MSIVELTQKDVHTVQPGDTIAKAARLMCDKSVSAPGVPGGARSAG